MVQGTKTLRTLLLVSAVLGAAASAQADTGKELFDKLCSGCHTIGGGDGGGPDLKGVAAKHPAAWLERVIVEPDKLTAEKDPAQQELVKKFGMEMPNLGVSREDARKIVAFLGGGAPAQDAAGAPAGAQQVPGAAPEAAKPEVPVTKELVATGVALFTGKERFSKGGAPCVSCHRLSYPGINGGTLAKDLSGLYGRLGENGTQGVLKGLSFPIMKKIYAERPLSEEEITALTALFKDQAAQKQAADDPYPAAGLGFFALCLAGAIAFKRRIR